MRPNLFQGRIDHPRMPSGGAHRTTVQNALGVDVPLRQAAHNLRTDRATAQVATALRDGNIPMLLLKGPAIATRLYPDEARPYDDSDVLVPEGCLTPAGDALRALGFRLAIEPADDLVASWQQHSQTWTRDTDVVCVELHWTLTHVRAPPERAWDVLSRNAETTRVCGVDVPTAAPAQLAAIVALHVAAHGSITPRPVQDLERALAHFFREVWTQAAGIAEELDASAAFATGLRALEPGRRLADDLGLGSGRPLHVALTAEHVPARARLGATLIDEVARASGPRSKGQLVWRALFPSPAYMRLNGKPLAQHGRIGLAASYALRPFDLASKAPGAWRAWRRASRGAADAG